MAFLIFYFFFSNMLSWFNFYWAYTKEFENFFFVVITEGTFLFFNYMLQVFIVHSSCSLTQEASQTAVIIRKVVNSKFCDKFRERIFKKFLQQNQYRNLKLETLFFTIDWKLLMAVSFEQSYNTNKSFDNNFKPSQIISTMVTYLIITCQFAPPISNYS
jgi:hypothetical protein